MDSKLQQIYSNVFPSAKTGKKILKKSIPQTIFSRSKKLKELLITHKGTYVFTHADNPLGHRHSGHRNLLCRGHNAPPRQIIYNGTVRQWGRWRNQCSDRRSHHFGSQLGHSCKLGRKQHASFINCYKIKGQVSHWIIETQLLCRRTVTPASIRHDVGWTCKDQVNFQILKEKQNPARLTQDRQDNPLSPRIPRLFPACGWGCTYAHRRRGPADLSLGAGSRRACTAHSCVPRCCAGSRHTRPRWCSPLSCTQPCRSGTGWSAHCSCTLWQRQSKVRVLGEVQLCRKDRPVSTKEHEGFYTRPQVAK